LLSSLLLCAVLVGGVITAIPIVIITGLLCFHISFTQCFSLGNVLLPRRNPPRQCSAFGRGGTKDVVLGVPERYIPLSLWHAPSRLTRLPGLPPPHHQ
jgi:hypothetical protein